MKKYILIQLLLLLSAGYLYPQKVVRIGAFNHYPAIFQNENGEIKGFYADAFHEISEKENIQIQYIFGTWSQCLERIKSDEIDMMVSVAHTDERATYMDYSTTPLLTVWGEVYVLNSSEIDGILNLEGKTLAVMKSDANGEQLKILTKKLSVHCTFIEKPDFQHVFESIVAKEVDAGVVNNTFGAAKSEEYNLRSSGIVFNPFDIYITVHKDKNKDLLNLFDEYLKTWKHDENSVFNKSRQKWSHGKVDTIKIIPNWLKYSLFLIIAFAVILIVFIMLLRHRVKIATAKVQKSEAMFKTFMENSTAFVYIKDESLKHIYSNQKVEELVTGKGDLSSASSIFDPETVKLLEEADRKILNLEVNQLNLVYFATIKGKKRWFQDYKFLLQLSGEKPRVGGVALDITKIKEIEEELIASKEKAEESNRLKSTFLQNMSHEVRTPLNAIQGFSELITYPNQNPEKIIKYSKIINQSCEKLINIITDVIEMSQIQTKQVRCNCEYFEFYSFFNDIINPFRQSATDKNIQFIVTPNLGSDELYINSDIDKLTRIFKHIIDNAIKFTTQGSVEINLEISQFENLKIKKSDNNFQINKFSNYLIISIKDTGIGISPEMQQIIFEPFRQVETGSARTYGGNGLGLSLVKAFIELLGGNIQLQSEINKGTEITVSLPLNIEQKQSPVHTTQYLPTRISTVLIVEDEYTNYLYLAELLEKFNINILHAENGQIALDLCRNNSEIDLILMDIKMPKLDGHTAAKLIKEFRSNIPIIAQSAYALESERAKYEGIFDDYITKPIDPVVLNQKIMKYSVPEE